MGRFEDFVKQYTTHVAQRAKLDVPPLPLDRDQVAEVAAALIDPPADATALTVHGCASTIESLVHLLDQRVPPGVYPASYEKAAFLGGLVAGTAQCAAITPLEAIKMLGKMAGGACVPHLIAALRNEGDVAATAADALGHLLLFSTEEIEEIESLAATGNAAARDVLVAWARADWFADMPAPPTKVRGIVIRSTGEINTDFFSPAQHAPTRDDIPLHALEIFSTSPHDKDFRDRLAKLKEQDLPIIYAGDVVGTGSSRKSASNSLVWCIGEDIDGVPNKRRGGFLFAAKIAPIFFNTIRGCGAIPVRCSTGKLTEGSIVEVDYAAGRITSEDGELLTEFKVEPRSILDESRAGGRNQLIIGRKLTARAREKCAKLGLDAGTPAVSLPEPPADKPGQHFSLAQKLVGQTVGRPGVLPNEYVEPRAHLVFSQDTTGKMTQQELQELACTQFATTFIQSFCHTAAGPRSKDSKMQTDLGAFVAELGGIDLRPGDGVIHTNGNRFLLPYFVGTGGDSHTRFPIGLSFPAGSDLVAFAASQGYFPLDMPESVLVRFKGRPRPGITVRDLVNSIPYVALQTGKLNLEKGDAKVNVFADRILEMEGLEFLTVEEAYKLTDTSAERSAAASVFRHHPDQIVRYVENNLRFLRNNFGKRHPASRVATVIEQMEKWLAAPEFLDADADPVYADVIEVDLDQITEPLLAAPNDPDKIVTLSEAAGTAIDEVFIGSCMTDITDFRGAAAILQGQRVDHRVKLWTVPPDRESLSELATKGIVERLLLAGANVHVPGCSLCMGNQAQVQTGATVVSTSTRNFDNRMGQGAQVYLGSSFIGAMTALTGRIPDLEEYTRVYNERVAPVADEMSTPLVHV